MVSSLQMYTNPELLPPPPVWMLKEVELLEKIEKMTNDEYEERRRYIETNNGLYKKFEDLQLGQTYNFVKSFKTWHYEDIKYIYRIYRFKLIKETKCYVTFEISGNLFGIKERYEVKGYKRDIDGSEYVLLKQGGSLRVPDLYDPKKDKISAAKIIQRGFRYHRWNPKGKFCWKVEERLMNDDGFCWDENGEMIK
jgi:hypothetical protein